MDIRIKDFSNTLAEDLLNIYAPYVLDNAVSFEYKLPSLTEFSSRLKSISENENILIAEKDGKSIGYAYSSVFRTRAAYRFVKEVSVYIHPNHQGAGIGKLLYQSLFDKLKSESIDSVIAVITLPNENSVRFHKKMGFDESGIVKRAGKKFDQWHDIAIMQKMFIDDPLNI